MVNVSCALRSLRYFALSASFYLHAKKSQRSRSFSSCEREWTNIKLTAPREVQFSPLAFHVSRASSIQMEPPLLNSKMPCCNLCSTVGNVSPVSSIFSQNRLNLFSCSTILRSMQSYEETAYTQQSFHCRYIPSKDCLVHPGYIFSHLRSMLPGQVHSYRLFQEANNRRWLPNLRSAFANNLDKPNSRES